jgi:hypothetical protein
MTFTATRSAVRTLGVLAAGSALALVAVAGPAAAVDGPPAYYPSGPQVNVDQADLAGWTLCYSGPYGADVPLYGAGGIIDELCTGDYLMLAGGPLDDPILTLLAAAPRADVLTDTLDDFTTSHNANGSEWYFNGNRSWGFALGGDPVNKDTCDYADVTNGQFRLCFHAAGQALYGGYRAGTNIDLNNSADWTRYIYQSNGTPGPALAATGVDTSAPLIAAGGLLIVGAFAVAFAAAACRRTAR